MNYISEGLYMGNVDDAYQTERLKAEGITHILTIDTKPLKAEATDGFEYKYVHAFDMETEDLLSHMEDCLSFIEEGCKSGAVFVHCFAGRSRSATVAIGYLMRKFDMTFEDTLKMASKQRGLCPNPGFAQQLKMFEAMGNKVDPHHEQYKAYRLNIIAGMMKSSQMTDSVKTLLHDHMSCDPAKTSSNNTELLYKCKKCRRALFKKSSLMVHIEGIGDAAFDWRAAQLKDAAKSHAEKNNCAQSLFVEPLQWMQDDILQIQGKLACPKCAAKLGSFNWAGERCPCGSWVTPAFHIQTAKVDESVPRQIAQIPTRAHAYMPRQGSTGDSQQSHGVVK